MLADGEIVRRFLEAKLQVHPDVVSYLREKNDPHLLERVVSGIPHGTLVVSPAHLPDLSPVKDGERFLPEPDLEVIAGRAGDSPEKNRFEDFFPYFRDRYTRLAEILRSRVNPVPIEALVRSTRYRQEECMVVGMVTGVRTTANGHRLVDLEDPTGQVPVLFNKGREGFTDAERILPDEVIGARGRLSQDGRLLFAEQLVRPDVPLTHAPFTSPRPGKAVLISDIHAGSSTFLADAWERFAEWLPSSGAAYLLVCGDLVDGIGIYPNQEEELVIRDIYEQYQHLAELMVAVPKEIAVVISPGNHDVVRPSEPQVAIPEEFRKGFPPNCTFVENPATLSLQGVRVVMYHGRSIDDMIGLIPRASYSRPEEMMVEMLERRHLAPVYGRRTPVSPEPKDRLLIDPVPEILHTGHVHTSGITRHRGILGVNAGCWQSQTKFQKQVNITPTPGRAVMVDLQTLEPKVMEFA
ncbi:MAG TPA: DNA-directed DNA polymerase II small subunit [Methanomicrobiales archaeon]|nr:DNA-directed DNA polymerase II small subunit [Methanomicrobiales archaeon]